MTDKVLIVDDDPFISRAFKRSFQRDHFETLTAESAVEALRILETHEIAVVVSDQRMPGMSGSELMVLVRDRYPGTVRILLTGYATLETALEAINQAEVHRFLLKPCSLEELGGIVRRAIACRKALLEVQARLRAMGEDPKLSEALTRHSRDAISVLCSPDPVADGDSTEQLIACRED